MQIKDGGALHHMQCNGSMVSPCNTHVHQQATDACGYAWLASSVQRNSDIYDRLVNDRPNPEKEPYMWQEATN